jgi:hypothetical protein
LCLAIGAAYALVIFGWDFFSQETYFWSAVGGDMLVSLSAGRYYIHDPWAWPLFLSPSLGAPEGTVIVFTDAVPLFALLAKTVYSLFGVPIPYYGLWIICCFGLQGMCAAGVVLAAGERHPVPIVAACLLALSLPAFLFRFQHVSLLGHFLILLALLAYIAGTRPGGKPDRPWWAVAWPALLLFAAILVHPYLAAMAATLLLAALLRATLDRRLTPLQAAGLLGVTAAGAVGLMVVAGHIGSGFAPSVAAGFGGFGHFSMNLASPLVPQLSGLFPPFPGSLEHLFPAPAALGGVVDATGGQYEGFNYLGAGLLALIAVGLLARPRYALAGLKRHWLFAALCIGLLLFALSDRAFLLERQLYSLPLGDTLRGLAEQFRSSGRFFWPVTYALMITAVLLVWRGLPRRVAVLALAAAVALQLADTRPLRATLSDFVHQSGDPREPFGRAIWQPIIARHELVMLLPPVACHFSHVALQFQIRAAYDRVPITSAWASGRTNADCAAAEAAARTLDGPPPGVLLIYPSVALSPDEVAARQADASLCRQFPGGVACSRHPGVTWLPETHFTPLPPVLR